MGSDAGAAWRPLQTADRSWTLLHPVHGEACHSRAGAWQESLERYALACGLACAVPGSTLRLLDVGTGLGLNLAAALHVLAPRGVGLEAVGLERDPEVLRAALELGARPGVDAGPWGAPHACARAALGLALADPARAAGEGVPWGPGDRGGHRGHPGHRGTGGRAPGRLRLLLGDARTTLAALDPAERFDAVFLDPFSPAREPELWGADFLGELARRMAPGSLLSTYSAAWRVRLALARAGLRVGRGQRVGAKAEGTLASPDRALEPLPARLQRRLARTRPAPCGNWGAGGQEPPSAID